MGEETILTMNHAATLQALRQRLRACQELPAAELPLAELFAVGAGLDRGGDREAALAAFERCVEAAPTVAGSWQAVAALRQALGRPRAALVACNEALRLAPDDTATLFNAAVLLESLGETEGSRLAYERVLQQAPRHSGALLNLVPLLLREQAVAAAGLVSAQALAAYPESADHRFNHGETQLAAGDYVAALAAYEHALQLQPDMVKAAIAAAVARAALGQLAEASSALASLASEQPAAFSAFSSPLAADRGATDTADVHLDAGRIALFAAYQRLRECDFTDRARCLALFEQVIAGDGCRPLHSADLPFMAIGLPLPGEARLRMATQVARQIAGRVGGVRLARSPRRASSRLRVAYLSGDFRQHATAWLTRQLPALHDRARFEVILYATGPDDGGELRQEMAAAADAFHDLRHLDAAASAQRIAMDGVDLLVDLAGYAQYARPATLALRPAPLQVAYLAYLQTTGAPWIDYALLDRQVLSAAERKWWSEKIAYLPDTFYLCDDRLPLASETLVRNDWGLPAGTFVFACFNAPWKIDPDSFSCWMEILRRVPAAVLWLYADSPAAAANLAAAANAAGIAPGRLLFTPTLPHAQHLARYRSADVFLDTFACNAHTTCVEALAAGVPLVTLPGEQVASRMAAGLLAAHGIPELVADSAADYVDLAVRLAIDADWRQALRIRLAERAGSRLFCSERRVREIERAYSMMWERHLAGLPPADFDVPATL